MVGLLIITHNEIGRTLLETAGAMLGLCPLKTEVVPVYNDSDPDVVLAEAKVKVMQLNDGDGVLVLTDMYGSTPSNIAGRMADGQGVVVVNGINLPMLVRIMNYPRLSLIELARKAESGGRDGVFLSSVRGAV